MLLALVLAALVLPGSARGQFRSRVDLDRVRHRIDGRLVDYTHNHGADHRIVSPILGRPRDLYVYLPPGYRPDRAYPLLLYLHPGYVDEHYFLGDKQVVLIDKLIRRGELPPLVVACPDGLIDSENVRGAAHSLFVNGVDGRFGDHLLGEVLPFVEANYSIRPDRAGHAILGLSAGGFGALSLGIRHRDRFDAVATLAAPANLRYDDRRGGSRADFDPSTYRWKAEYDPDEVVGAFYLGARKVPASKYVEPVFGTGPAVAGRIAALNPADLLFGTDLRPGELALYLNYPGRDSFNFDAHAESFAWLAASRGVRVELARDPCNSHSIFYFRANHRPALEWIGRRLAPSGG